MTENPSPREQPPAQQAGSEGGDNTKGESPALSALYETLGAAQAGLDVRRKEVAEDLKKLDEQEQHWQAERDKAWAADDNGAYSHALSQLEAARMLRTQLMHDLGDEPERYGVTGEQTLDPEDERGSGVTRNIVRGDVDSDQGA